MIIVLLSIATHSYSQSIDPMAQIVSIEHACGSKLGSVEFELLGEPQNFTYNWAHGPSTLSLSNLLPGTYTLSVNGTITSFPSDAGDNSDIAI